MKNLLFSAFVFSFALFIFEIRPAAAQKTIAANLAKAAESFAEADALCKADHGKLWRTSLCAPLLFVDPQTRAVVANQADKEGFLSKNGNVFIGTLPANVNVANTAVSWAGVKWTMVMIPLPADKFARANLLAHEMWHRIQDEIDFPQTSAANNHLDTRDGRIWLQLEWRALAKALDSNDKKAKKQAIADAALFRAYRRFLFPNAAEKERAMEMHEGLAEYTGVALNGSPNRKRYTVASNLEPAAQRESFVRSFAYASGPAYGLLLDDTKTNWRANLKREDDLGELLRTKSGVKLPADLKTAAERRAAVYDGAALNASETTRENNRRQILADYRARLIDGAILEIPLQKMNMQFNPGNLVPIENRGTVYPNIRIVDVWGILDVTTGGALLDQNYSKITVAAPKNPEQEKITGDGWTLELQNGWKIAPGARPGDYTIRKSE